jgi:uncharacterized protein (DUF362 family)
VTDASRPRVFVARVDNYDVDAIQAAVERGLEHVRFGVRGNVVAQANWVFAQGRGVSPAACTRPEVVHAALDALFERDPKLHVLFTGNSAVGLPTRRMARAAGSKDPLFRRKGFYALPKLHRGRVSIRPTDETRYLRYQLSVGRPMNPEERLEREAEVPAEVRYWERVVTGWELYHADSVVSFPKLKTSVLAQGFSGAVKLQGVGLLRDVDRMDGHTWHNHRRLVDMLEVADPDLVVTDAIKIGLGGSGMTQSAHRLGVIVVADNAVAHDAVCATILGLDPARIGHLKIASERGFGPLDLDAIDLVTEVPLETLKLRVEGFGPRGLIPVDRFGEHFERVTGYPFPIEVKVGGDYDATGAAGIVLDWLYTAWDHPDRREKMKAWPPASVLVGDCTDVPGHARVFLVGNRAIEAFRRRVTFATTVRIPASIQKVLGGLAAIHRYKLDGGRTGWAVEIPGDPPSLRDLAIGFFLGSVGRMRASMMRSRLLAQSYVFGTLAALRRRRRNRDGIAVVHARKIERLSRRSWRLLHAPSERLQLRPPLPLPPPRPDHAPIEPGQLIIPAPAPASEPEEG